MTTANSIFSTVNANGPNSSKYPKDSPWQSQSIGVLGAMALIGCEGV